MDKQAVILFAILAAAVMCGCFPRANVESGAVQVTIKVDLDDVRGVTLAQDHQEVQP